MTGQVTKQYIDLINGIVKWTWNCEHEEKKHKIVFILRILRSGLIVLEILETEGWEYKLSYQAKQNIFQFFRQNIPCNKYSFVFRYRLHLINTTTLWDWVLSSLPNMIQRLILKPLSPSGPVFFQNLKDVTFYVISSWNSFTCPSASCNLNYTFSGYEAFLKYKPLITIETRVLYP